MKIKKIIFILLAMLCCSFLWIIHDSYSVGKEYAFALVRQEYIVPAECKSYLPDSAFFYGKERFRDEYLNFVIKHAGSFTYLLNQNSKNAMQRTQSLSGKVDSNEFVVSRVFNTIYQDSVMQWCKGKSGEEVCFFTTEKYSEHASEFATRIDSVTFFLKCFMR